MVIVVVRVTVTIIQLLLIIGRHKPAFPFNMKSFEQDSMCYL